MVKRSEVGIKNIKAWIMDKQCNSLVFLSISLFVSIVTGRRFATIGTK